MERQPAINLLPVILFLALSLIALHTGRYFLSADADDWVLFAFGFLPARYSKAAALWPGGIGACLWTPLTHAFLHADAVHLIGNLFWMVSFGTPLARRFGSVRFLALSGLSAAAGAGFHYLLFPGDQTLLIGASGAVSGMTAATARFAFAPGGPLMRGASAASYRLPAEPFLAVFRSSRALFFILAWFAINFLFGITDGLGADQPIAWEAHIGGFLAGIILFPLLDPVPREGATPLAS